MTNVKFFEKSDIEKLEENINNFLTKAGIKKIIDIKYQQVSNSLYSALIIYEF